jgi:endonuclease-8
VPEGDAVYRTARRLGVALDGRVLVRSDFRVPRHATADLTGRTVIGTVSYGKHLLTRVEGGLTVHTHLRMAGPPRHGDHRRSPPWTGDLGLRQGRPGLSAMRNPHPSRHDGGHDDPL